MQTRKNANLAPESFRHSAVPRRLKHRARRRRRILCLLPVILVFGVLAAALLRFTPALAYADIFPAQATTRRIKDVPYTFRSCLRFPRAAKAPAPPCC